MTSTALRAQPLTKHAFAKSKRTTYTGTIESNDGERRNVRITSVENDSRYDFLWGVSVIPCEIMKTKLRPLTLYDLMTVGMSTGAQHLFAYLSRAAVLCIKAKKPPVVYFASISALEVELGCHRKYIKSAIEAFIKLKIIMPVDGTKIFKGQFMISPFVFYVGKMSNLKTSMEKEIEKWTPSADAWTGFWASGNSYVAHRMAEYKGMDDPKYASYDEQLAREKLEEEISKIEKKERIRYDLEGEV